MERPTIIAVDFDGCLCQNAWPNIGEPRQEIIDTLLERQKNGAKIILWTCRVEDKLAEAVHWCGDRGLFFDAVNANLEENIEAFGNDCRKVFADEYWDDKAVLMPHTPHIFNYIPIKPGDFQSVLDAWDPNSVHGHTPIAPTNRISVNPRYFIFLLELARTIESGTKWDKKARIVLEYDPHCPKMEIKTFMERDAATPPADRGWFRD